MAEEEKTSDQLRRELSALLERVKWEGLAVRVRRYTEDTAVLVPADWYDRAVAAIGMPGAPQQQSPAAPAKEE